MIVVADEKDIMDDARSALTRRDLYIAFTRPRAVLHVIGSKKAIRKLKSMRTSPDSRRRRIADLER